MEAQETYQENHINVTKVQLLAEVVDRSPTAIVTENLKHNNMVCQILSSSKYSWFGLYKNLQNPQYSMVLK